MSTDDSFADQLFATLQSVLPKHLLSRFIYHLMRSELPWLRRTLIGGFLQGYTVDMSEAMQSDPFAYASFNAFFTRALKPDARPVAAAQDALVSPVDGTVSQCGPLHEERLLQAKGREYSVIELLGGDASRAECYRGGSFACIYLAPYNYHRIHMPASATLRDTLYIPGELFSVNAATARAVPNLFGRNERVVCEFDSAWGRFAMVFVGALFVGSMETVWCGDVNPPPRRRGPAIAIDTGRGRMLQKGEEAGRFNMGSTVIMVFEPGRVRWDDDFAPAAAVRMGRRIGTLLTQP